nr:TrkA family potassium uptake protein [Halorhabdus rudnickae]
MAPTSDLRVVVVGSGQTGLRTARLLDDRGHDVVIVERNPDRVRAVAQEYIAQLIEGDATDPDVLKQADLQSADVLAAMTDTMGTNFTVCTLATEIAPEIRTVMRSVYETNDHYDSHADAVVTPELAGARMTVNAIEDDVTTLAETSGELELLEISVAPDSPVAGRLLREIALPTGSLVVADCGEQDIANGETTLRPGETYLLAVKPSVVTEVTRLFQG